MTSVETGREFIEKAFIGSEVEVKSNLLSKNYKFFD